MFQVSSRKLSLIAFRAKGKVPVVARNFSALTGSDAVVELKRQKIPTYTDPIATVDIKSLTYEGKMLSNQGVKFV